MFRQSDERADHIGHVTKTAALGAVAVDRDGLAAVRLAHEARDDHPVAARLAGTNRVEESDDNDW